MFLRTSYLHHVFKNWICLDEVFKIDCCNHLTDINETKKTIKQSEHHDQNAGIFGAVIGVLDGRLIKIKFPAARGDGVEIVDSFYCKKSYHALNMKVIVDRNKKLYGAS